MNRHLKNKMLATVIVSAGAVLSVAACGQLTGQNQNQPASVTTIVSPSASVSPANPAPSTDDSPSPGRSVQPGADAISRERAIQIALNRTGGGNLDKVEDEFEQGRAAWKVRIVKDGIRYSVYVDKANGEIIRFRDEGQH